MDEFLSASFLSVRDNQCTDKDQNSMPQKGMNGHDGIHAQHVLWKQQCEKRTGQTERIQITKNRIPEFTAGYRQNQTEIQRHGTDLKRETPPVKITVDVIQEDLFENFHHTENDPADKENRYDMFFLTEEGTENPYGQDDQYKKTDMNGTIHGWCFLTCEKPHHVISINIFTRDITVSLVYNLRC